MNITDLEALRTPEEIATFQTNVAARMKDIDNEFGVKPMTPEAASEFADLKDLNAEVTSRLKEIAFRQSVIGDALKNEANAVPAVQPIRTAPQVRKALRVPENIYALEQYRSMASSEGELHQAYRDGAMYAVERATYANPQSDPAKEQAHIAKLLETADRPSPQNPNRELSQRIIATGSETYIRAFTKYIQGRPLNADEQRAAAPWTVQTDATGGYAVPFSFDPTILHTGAWTNVNPYRQACTVKTIVGTDTYHAPTAAAFTVARAAEAAASTEGLGAVGQISAIVGKVHGAGKVSIELLQDRPDIVSEIASLISEAKDTEEENIFSVGAGDALGAGYNPIGMFGAAHTTSGAYTHIDTAAADGAIAAVDAYAVEAALPIRHRARAAWFMNRGVIRLFQALETTGGQLFGGQYYNSVGYPQQSPVGNTGLRLLQYPIWETPSAPPYVAATNDLVVAALCDPSSYYIVERAGMSVEVVQHFLDATTGYPTGERLIYAWWRNTAKPANVDAGRRLALLA